MATVDEQLAVINTKQFLTDLMTKVKAIHGAFQQNGITVEGDIHIVVSQVLVVYNYRASDNVIAFRVGVDDTGNGLRSFEVPTLWMVG